jgi:hypothetical protein
VIRRGWTLHEMIISLGVLGGVIALAAHVASGQLRLFRDIGDSSARARQMNQTTAIVAAALSHVSSAGGDIIVALDSAIEFHSPVGTALTCDGQPGRVTFPAADGRSGNVFAAFTDVPKPGDRIHALLEDSLGATWLLFHAGSTVTPVVGCAHFPSVEPVWSLELREAITIPGGVALQFTRPLRLSLYRSSDASWYLGARDWNDETGQFNTIQPVTGPLRPYSQNPDSTGLSFVYRDNTGAVLSPPFDAGRIASISVTSRVPGPGREDAVRITVAFRNAR